MDTAGKTVSDTCYNIIRRLELLKDVWLLYCLDLCHQEIEIIGNYFNLLSVELSPLCKNTSASTDVETSDLMNYFISKFIISYYLRE